MTDQASTQEDVSEGSAPSAPVDRAQVPLVHVYPQDAWHGSAYIVANGAGLMALRQAIDEALTRGRSEAEVMAADGEGYGLRAMHLSGDIASEGWRALGLPYTDEEASAPEHQRGATWPDEMWSGSALVTCRICLKKTPMPQATMVWVGFAPEEVVRDMRPLPPVPSDSYHPDRETWVCKPCYGARLPSMVLAGLGKYEKPLYVSDKGAVELEVLATGPDGKPAPEGYVWLGPAVKRDGNGQPNDVVSGAVLVRAWEVERRSTKRPDTL